MKLLPGWELVSLTDTEIVQRKAFGENGGGMVTIRGNPNPDPEEHRKGANDLATFLYKCVNKAQARERMKEIGEEHSSK